MKVEEYILRRKLDIVLERTEISVLVPVCNVENYLEQCLDSLIAQSFKNIEIICIDDGSTDQSGAILDRYAASDQRVKVIHKENTGYGNSMNIAMDHASGNYIAILESDDFAEPDMLEKMYKAAIGKSADVVKGNYYNYRNKQDTFSNRIEDYPQNKIFNCSLCPKLMNLADTIWSCLYRHLFLKEHNIRFHETAGASYQDISFALQVWLQAERVYFIKDALLHYRRDNPNSSMNNPSKLFCVFDEYRWAEEILRGILSHNPILNQYFTASKYRDYLNHYYRVGIQYQYALLVRLEKEFLNDKEDSHIAESSFIPSVWRQICEMEADKNQFFKKTARKIPDSRLTNCGFKNEEIYQNAFLKQLESYPKVFVYGAGQVGKSMAKAILERGGRVDAFLVTKNTDGDSFSMGIPVFEIQEAVPWADACGVIIAVTEWNQYELYEILENYQFRHVFRTDETLRKMMG